MWCGVLVWTGIQSNSWAGKLRKVAADLIGPVGVGTGNKRYCKLICPFNNILCRIGAGTQFIS